MNYQMKPPLGSQIQFGHPLATGLIGCWLFNEDGGNIVQDPIRGTIGTFSGTGLTWVPGKFGSAIDGDASDYVDFGVLKLVAGQPACTVVTWVYIPGNTVLGLTAAWEQEGAGLDCGGLWTDVSENVTFQMRDSANINKTASFHDGLLNNPGWHQLIGTYDGANVRVYVDLVLGETVIAMTGVIQPAPQVNFVLCKSVHPVSHVMFWNRALSASERSELFANPFAVFERGPIELWTGATSVGAPPVGNPGIMTTWGGYWGATY